MHTRRLAFALLAIAGVFLAYSITIRLALQLDFRGSLLGGAANTVPVVIFGALAYRLIRRKLVGKPAVVQLALHLLLCVAFVTLSYAMLIVLLGLFYGRGPEGFLVQPFSTSGTAWQTLENVTTYALIATASYLQGQQVLPIAATVARVNPDGLVASSPARESGEVPEAGTDPVLSRYFVRIGDELRPLDVDTVVSIGGADDYSEVRTLSGKHLVRVTLAEFARSLDPAQYVRVHRSWIVNVHRVLRAESAGGGRLHLHMEAGHTISTSRAGAKLLRDRVI
jgi:hypothetical protein